MCLSAICAQKVSLLPSVFLISPLVNSIMIRGVASLTRRAPRCGRTYCLRPPSFLYRPVDYRIGGCGLRSFSSVCVRGPPSRSFALTRSCTLLAKLEDVENRQRVATLDEDSFEAPARRSKITLRNRRMLTDPGIGGGGRPRSAQKSGRCDHVDNPAALLFDHGPGYEPGWRRGRESIRHWPRRNQRRQAQPRA